MENQDQMMKATTLSLWIVFAAYIVMGEIIAIIFWPTFQGIQGDITSILPNESYMAIAIRMTMMVVLLSSTPLIVVPCGDLVQRKLSWCKTSMMSHDDTNVGKFVRIAICIFGSIISNLVPNFVYIISFVGCFCAPLLCYIYPPLAYISCILKLHGAQSLPSSSTFCQVYLDCIILLVGMTCCFFTSYETFEKIIYDMKSNG